MPEEATAAVSRRSVVAGAAATLAGAALSRGLDPSIAEASEDDDLAVLSEAPVNALSFLEPVDPGDTAEQRLGKALVRALAHAESSDLGRVYAPPGTYDAAGLSVPANVRLFGAGPKTILRCPSASSSAVVLGTYGSTTSGAGAALSDLKILDAFTIPDGHPVSQPTQKFGMVEIYASGCRVERVEIVTPRWSGIELKGRPERTRIEGCRIVDPREAGIVASLSVGSLGDIPGVEVVGNKVEMIAKGRRGINIARGTNGVGTRFAWTRILGNEVVCGEGADPSTICIQTFNKGVAHAVISGNRTVGGNMGISTNHSPRTAITANRIEGAGYIGIELAAGEYQDPPEIPSADPSGTGTNGTAVVGNVIDGRRGSGSTSRGIVSSTGGDGFKYEPAGYVRKQSSRSLEINGNVIRGCVSGLWIGGTDSLNVIGNTVTASDVDGIYDGFGTGANAYSGIMLRQAKGLVCIGNQVDGLGRLPVGINLNSIVGVVCTGNRVLGCAGSDYGPREIWMQAVDPAPATLGDGTRGAIVGNQARVVVTNTPTGNARRGGCEDLRTEWNTPILKQYAPSAGRLVVPATEALVKVTGSGTINRVDDYYAGDTGSVEPRNYPGREVTLVFAGSTIVDTGGNIRLAGALEAKAGDTLTLVGAGDDDPGGDGWFEASRSVN